jgi:hypothetical protein
MNQPSIRIFLLNTAGLYYVATQQPDDTYTIITDSSAKPILTLPKGWEDMRIMWDRDNKYQGVFTTQGQNLTFVKDARYILMSLYYAAGGGIQAECVMRVEKFIDVFTGYETCYECEIDFSSVVDEKFNGDPLLKGGHFTVPTLNGKLNELLSAYGDQQFNISMWKNTGTIASPHWVTNADFGWHPGIKLLFNTSYKNYATTGGTLSYRSPNDMKGFNHGDRGNSCHTIPTLSPFNATQNNGATTFIGNTVLEAFLIQGSQTPGAAHIVNEIDFNGTNSSQANTKNNFSLRHNLPSQPTIEMSVRVQGQFSGVIDLDGTSPDPFIGFYIFELDSADLPPLVTIGPNTFLQYTALIEYGQASSGVTFPAAPYAGFVPPAGGVFDSGLVPITLNYGKVYVLSIVYDGKSGGGIGIGASAAFELSNLELSFLSNFNSGSAAPVDAPRFNATPLMGFYPYKVLQQLVPMLNSYSSDSYGFPIVPAGTPYAGVSNFLSHDNVRYDNSPTRTLMVSANAMQLLPGYPYMSMSINELFNTCFNVWGCGLGIDGNNIIIEDLAYFYNNTGGSSIDLKNNVASMKIEPLTDIMNIFLQTGYSGQSTNNNVGVDAFCKELDYDSPLTKVPGTTMNLVVSIIAEMYRAEIARSQQANSPLPTSPISAGQSGGNDTYIFDLDTFAPVGPIAIPYPDNSGSFNAFPLALKTYPNAQNSDPTAASAPYVNGLYYPDTALNLGLTPGKNIRRLGAYLHSMLDGQEGANLMFRKIYQMLYNNTSELVPGITTNLQAGAGATPINEVADIPISDLDPILFRPYKITLTTVAPVNMWPIMSTADKYKYMQWTWKGVQWKGYLEHVEQNLALNKPTTYILRAHQSVTNDMITNA